MPNVCAKPEYYVRYDINILNATFLAMKRAVDGLEIKLKSHKKPDKYEVIFTQDSQYISDMDIASYIDNINTFTNHQIKIYSIIRIYFF